MYRRKGLRKRAYRRKSTVARSKKGSVSVGVKKYVKNQIHRNIENKCVQIQNALSFGNYVESTDLNAFPMLPLTGYFTIPQGTGQGGRIGNTLKVRKVMLSYVVFAQPYDVLVNPTPIPQEVDMYLGYVREKPSTVPTNIDTASLYQAGSSTATPQGSLRDLVSTINTDYWIIKKRWRHKIGYSSNSGTGGNAGNAFFANNDFKLNEVRKLNITSMCPATMKFNDATNTQLNRNLFFMFQAVRSDGAVAGGTILPCRIEYFIDIEYEDA